MSKRKKLAIGIYTLISMAAAGCSSSNSFISDPQPTTAYAAVPLPETDEPMEQFVARWNAWVDSIPEDQRVGDDLPEAEDRMWIGLSVLEGKIASTYWPEYVIAYARPDNQYWDDLQLVLDNIRPGVDTLREGIDRPWMVFRIESSDENMVFGLKASSAARAAAEWILKMARIHGLQGHGDQSAADFVLVMNSVELVEQYPQLINWLGGLAIRSIIYDKIYDVLEWNPDTFTDDQLAEFQSKILPWVNHDFTRILHAEKYFDTYFLREIFKDSSNGVLSGEMSQQLWNDWFTMNLFYTIMKEPLFPEVTDYETWRTWFAPLDEQLAVLQRGFEAVEADLNAQPWSQYDLYFDEFILEIKRKRDWAQYLPALSCALSRSWMNEQNHRASTEARAAIIVLAIHRHRLQTGDWPKTLAEIDPKIMRIVPTDPLSGESFGYAIVGGGPELWAAGPDRDNDGGLLISSAPTESEEYSSNRERQWFTLNQWDEMSDQERDSYDGDWIIFPPALPDIDDE